MDLFEYFSNVSVAVFLSLNKSYPSNYCLKPITKCWNLRGPEFVEFVARLITPIYIIDTRNDGEDDNDDGTVFCEQKWNISWNLVTACTSSNVFN